LASLVGHPLRRGHLKLECVVDLVRAVLNEWDVLSSSSN
jgi:hypothetical protein